MSGGARNSADDRFVRPEQRLPADRTSESTIAELNYRADDEGPNIESRQRSAKALRDFLAAWGWSVARFADVHRVNEKQAAKWTEGRANYPFWGLERLSEDMALDLLSCLRAAKGTAEGKLAPAVTPMKPAMAWLRRKGTKRDVHEAQLELVAIAMAKDEGPC